MPRLRVLYSKGCPGGEPTANIIRELLDSQSAGQKADLSVEEFGHEEFLALGTPGSPTILLNGRDLFPTKERLFEFSPAASCCRLYATPRGLKSHPTRRMVREALDSSREPL